MGFEVYLQCFGKSEQQGIPRAEVRSLFPIIEEESGSDHWRVRYDERNDCHIGVTAIASDKAMLKSLYVDRPCEAMQLWEGLISVLQMGTVVMFWPGGPPVVADERSAADLPQDVIEKLGEAKAVHSAEELLALLRES